MSAQSSAAALELTLSPDEAYELIMALEDRLSSLREEIEELEPGDGRRGWRIGQDSALRPVLARLYAARYPEAAA